MYTCVRMFLSITSALRRTLLVPANIPTPRTDRDHPLNGSDLTLYRTVVRALNQKYLRDALQDIARMHTSGQHRNCWELKPEFKTAAEAGGGAGADADNEA